MVMSQLITKSNTEWLGTIGASIHVVKFSCFGSPSKPYIIPACPQINSDDN